MASSERQKWLERIARALVELKKEPHESASGERSNPGSDQGVAATGKAK